MFSGVHMGALDAPPVTRGPLPWATLGGVVVGDPLGDHVTVHVASRPADPDFLKHFCVSVHNHIP